MPTSSLIDGFISGCFFSLWKEDKVKWRSLSSNKTHHLSPIIWKLVNITWVDWRWSNLCVWVTFHQACNLVACSLGIRLLSPPSTPNIAGKQFSEWYWKWYFDLFQKGNLLVTPVIRISSCVCVCSFSFAHCWGWMKGWIKYFSS